MAAMELLCHILEFNPCKISKEENQFLEAVLFSFLCEELKEIFRINYKEYFRLMKFNSEMEDNMLEANFMRCVINDILSTDEYSIQGIANYTQLPEEVIYDIALGCNTSPSLPLSRKIIELHKTLRPNLYRDILKKVIAI